MSLDSAQTTATETSPLLSSENHGARAEDKDVKKVFWHEMRVISTYTLPILWSQLLESSLIFAPVISVGHLSTTALAAISLASLTGSVTGASVLQGLASALDTLLPSAYTSSQPQLVGLWSQRMLVIMAAALFPIYLIWLNAESIFISLNQDPEVAHLASEYLRWLSLCLPGLFYVFTRIAFIVAPFNILLNYLLVWGPEPVRLGFIGAPLATATSFTLTSILSILYGVYFAPRKSWHPLTMAMFTDLNRQSASKWWAWEFVGLAASFLGPVALASQSILLTSSATTFQAAFSLSSATSVRIGHLLGEGKAAQARVSTYASIVLALIVSLLTSAVYLGFRHSWGRMFNDDQDVVDLVASVIPLIAFFQIVDANSAVTAAILRARGLQSLGAMLNMTGFYVIGLPLGIWLAFQYKLGLHGLWIGLAAALVYCAIVGTVLSLKTDWDEEVRKVEERLAREERTRDRMEVV
ncbi:hypothetical protein DXG01_009339 [Tephrocybe rancida]|nr:hypothetical protein DXG01_009339 [Tephrocybe rancida]